MLETTFDELDRDNPYDVRGRPPKLIQVKCTIVLACGCKLEYETYPALVPQPGDTLNCFEHPGYTTVIRVE